MIKDCGLTLYPGDRVRFCGQCLAVAGKESRLEGGILKNTYLLCREKSWDDLLDGGGHTVEYVSPDGMIYRIRTSGDFRVNINLIDEAGDMRRIRCRLGKKAGDAGE